MFILYLTLGFLSLLFSKSLSIRILFQYRLIGHIKLISLKNDDLIVILYDLSIIGTEIVKMKKERKKIVRYVSYSLEVNFLKILR
ncbi:unnamed protein product, partial [marine sediment metagenome]